MDKKTFEKIKFLLKNNKIKVDYMSMQEIKDNEFDKVNGSPIRLYISDGNFLIYLLSNHKQIKEIDKIVQEMPSLRYAYLNCALRKNDSLSRAKGNMFLDTSKYQCFKVMFFTNLNNISNTNIFKNKHYTTTDILLNESQKYEKYIALNSYIFTNYGYIRYSDSFFPKCSNLLISALVKFKSYQLAKYFLSTQFDNILLMKEKYVNHDIIYFVRNHEGYLTPKEIVGFICSLSDIKYDLVVMEKEKKNGGK